MDFTEGRVALVLGMFLETFVYDADLGFVAGADGMMRIALYRACAFPMFLSSPGHGCRVENCRVSRFRIRFPIWPSKC